MHTYVGRRVCCRPVSLLELVLLHFVSLEGWPQVLGLPGKWLDLLRKVVFKVLIWKCAKKRFLSCFSFCVYWVYMCGIPNLTFQMISLVTWQTTYWLKWDISVEPRTCYLGYLNYPLGIPRVSFLPTAGIMRRLPCQSPRTRVLDIWTLILAFM